MHEKELELELKAVLSPTVWKSTLQLKRELEERWLAQKRIVVSVAMIERIEGLLRKLERARAVIYRQPRIDRVEWKLTSGERGMPADDLPIKPKEPQGDTARA